MVITMLRDCLTQQARVSQEDDVQIEEVLLLSIYVSLAEEVVGDAVVVREADAVVDGDRPRHRLDAGVSHSLPRWCNGHFR